MSNSTTDNDDDSLTHDDSVSKFYASFYINAAIGGVMLVVFCVIHRRRLLGLSYFFSPRKGGNDNARSVQFWTGLIMWIWESLSYPDKKLWQTHGADALTYVRFLRMCFLCCLVTTTISCSILLPLNLSGDQESDSLGDMGHLTMSHLDERDSKLVAHVVVVWVYSVFFYAILFYYYRMYAEVRMHWLNRNSPRTYTIVLLNIPHHMRFKRAIKDWFEDHFRTKVASVVLLWDDRKVIKLKERRAKYINKLELAKLDCAEMKKRRSDPFYCCGSCGKKVKKKGKVCACCCNAFTNIALCFSACFGFFKRVARKYCCCCCCFTYYEREGERRLTHAGFLEILGEEVDAVTYYREKVAATTEQIRNMQHNKKDKLKKSGVAFVTFTKVYPARVKINPYINPAKMLVSPAPDPSDVFWVSFNVSYAGQIFRMFVITAIMVVICLSWSSVSIVVSSISNLKNLAEVEGFEWIGDFLDVFPDQIQSIIEGYLPPVILYLVTLLMKPIIKFFYKKSGWLYAHSDVEWWTMSTYTVFLFFNVFLVSTIGSTLFTVLADFIDNPTTVVTLLATALPQQSLFFITYLMVAGAGRIPFKLFRPADLLRVLVRFVFTCPRTPRQRRTFHNLELWFDYAGEVGQGLLILTLVLVYSVMAPLITPFGIFYFFMDYIITRYNLIYANLTPWDSGGRLWPKIFHHTMSSVLVFQLVMLGIFGLNSNYQSAMWALIPLPLISIFYWVFIHFMWSPVSAFGPINGTFTLKQTFLDKTLLRKAYEQPSFKDPEEEIWEEDIEGYASDGDGDGDEEEKGPHKVFDFGDGHGDEDDVEAAAKKWEEMMAAKKKSGSSSAPSSESDESESESESESDGQGGIKMQETKQSRDERKRETAKRVEREMERRRRRRRGEDESEGEEEEEVKKEVKKQKSKGSKESNKAGGEGETATKKKPLPTPADVEALMRKINEAYEKRFERDMRELKWERKKERRREGME